MIEKARHTARKWLPRGLRRRLSRLFQWPPLFVSRFGLMVRKNPVSRNFGEDRGIPIDRFYIEKFLLTYAQDIKGHVLEIKEDLYATRMGGEDILRLDILNKIPGTSDVTIVADLTNAPEIPDSTYDCIIFTQTLQFIFDVKAVIETLHRILKPGGILLLTVPSISQISQYDMRLYGEFWRFTSLAVKLLLEECFPAENIVLFRYGNLAVANGFLSGMASGEFLRRELDYFDPDYELVIGARVEKPGKKKQYANSGH